MTCEAKFEGPNYGYCFKCNQHWDPMKQTTPCFDRDNLSEEELDEACEQMDQLFRDNEGSLGIDYEE